MASVIEDPWPQVFSGVKVFGGASSLVCIFCRVKRPNLKFRVWDTTAPNKELGQLDQRSNQSIAKPGRVRLYYLRIIDLVARGPTNYTQ